VGAVGWAGARLELPAELDSRLVELIQRCCAPDPRVRPTFAEAASALEALGGELPMALEAPPAGPSE